MTKVYCLLLFVMMSTARCFSSLLTCRRLSLPRYAESDASEASRAAIALGHTTVLLAVFGIQFDTICLHFKEPYNFGGSFRIFQGILVHRKT